MAYWLIKSEPETYSISDLERDTVTEWGGVRNYQARNYLRSMKRGEVLLFYHSNTKQTGIAGLAEVSKLAYAEPQQFDKKSDYFDPKAAKENPRWYCPEIKFLKRFAAIIPLEHLKKEKELSEMLVLKRGTRLSVQPVSDKEFEIISNLASKQKLS